MLSFVILRAIILVVIILSDVILSDAVLSVIKPVFNVMILVIMPRDVILSVVMPYSECHYDMYVILSVIIPTVLILV